MKTTHAAVTVAALAALVLTGCTPSERAVGNPNAPVHPNPTTGQLPAPEAAGEHNAADLAFAQGMVAHHEQALAMTALVNGKGASEQVTALAERIARAQEVELAQLQGFLDRWQAPEAGAMPGHGAEPAPAEPAPAPAEPGTAAATPGMLTPEQLTQLGAATGADFDRLFLQLMTAHHEGAVQMAQAEVAGGRDPEATALAQRIIDTQQAEIAEMRTLLGT